MSPIIQSLANASAYGYRSLSAAVTADTGAYFPLQVVTVGSAGASSITFSNIPSTYTHLQIRFTSKAGATYGDIQAQFNGDTASNYNSHYLYGTGSSAGSGSSGSTDRAPFGYGADTSGTYPVASVVDILDYANTNKYKTIRILTGQDTNGGGNIYFFSGLWRSTSAITSFTLLNGGSNNFQQYSSFALYGIKGA